MTFHLFPRGTSAPILQSEAWPRDSEGSRRRLSGCGHPGSRGAPRPPAQCVLPSQSPAPDAPCPPTPPVPGQADALSHSPVSPPFPPPEQLPAAAGRGSRRSAQEKAAHERRTGHRQPRNAHGGGCLGPTAQSPPPPSLSPRLPPSESSRPPPAPPPGSRGAAGRLSSPGERPSLAAASRALLRGTATLREMPPLPTAPPGPTSGGGGEELPRPTARPLVTLAALAGGPGEMLAVTAGPLPVETPCPGTGGGCDRLEAQPGAPLRGGGGSARSSRALWLCSVLRAPLKRGGVWLASPKGPLASCRFPAAAPPALRGCRRLSQGPLPASRG